jgi:hypothetical protein
MGVHQCFDVGVQGPNLCDQGGRGLLSHFGAWDIDGDDEEGFADDWFDFDGTNKALLW